MTVDSPCFDLAQAVTAANTLVNAGAVAVVGHTCSPSSMAAQPVYYTAGVAMISPSSTRPDVTRQGYNTTFRTVTHDGTPPAMLARYFEEWLDVDTAAIVESPGNSLLGDSFSDTFTALGGTITSRRVVTDTSFYLSSLTAIMAENPDAIANLSLDPNPANAGLFSLIAYGLGMTNTVLGASSWDNNEAWLDTYATAAGEIAADGDIVVLEFRRFQDMPGWADFLADYQAAGFPNETNDPYIFGPFAYDAANITMAAIDHIRAGYRRRSVERHMIYFRITAYGIAIVRILHDRMDAPRHF